MLPNVTTAPDDPVPADSEKLTESKIPVVKNKTFYRLKFAKPDFFVNLTHTFYPNGTILLKDNFGNGLVIKSIGVPLGNSSVTLFHNSTHVAYHYLIQNFQNQELINAWVMFDFAILPEEVKITIYGTSKVTGWVHIPLVPLSFTEVIPSRIEKKCDLDSKNFLSGKFTRFNETITAVGFSWNDVSSNWRWNAERNSIEFEIPLGDFLIDPSTIATTNALYGTQTPFQRSGFHAKGKFWQHFFNGSAIVLYESEDAQTWTFTQVILDWNVLTSGADFTLSYNDETNKVMYALSVNVIVEANSWGRLYARGANVTSDGIQFWGYGWLLFLNQIDVVYDGIAMDYILDEGYHAHVITIGYNRHYEHPTNPSDYPEVYRAIMYQSGGSQPLQEADPFRLSTLNTYPYPYQVLPHDGGSLNKGVTCVYSRIWAQQNRRSIISRSYFAMPWYDPVYIEDIYGGDGIVYTSAMASTRYTIIDQWFEQFYLSWLRKETTYHSITMEFNNVTQGSASSLSLKLTCSLADLIIVGVAIRGTETVQTVTFNGAGGSKIRSDSYGSDVRSELWYKVASPTIQTIVVTLSGSAKFVVSAVGVINADTSGTVFNTNNGNNGESSSPSVSLTTTLNNTKMVSMLGCKMVSGLTITEGENQYLINEGTTTGGSIASNVKGRASQKDADVSGSNNMNWTLTDSTSWSVSAVAINPSYNTAYHIYYSYKDLDYFEGWLAPTSIQPNVLVSTRPSMSSKHIAPYNERVTLFWAGSPTENHIFYKCLNSTWDWTEAVDWIDESQDGLTNYGRTLSVYERGFDNITGVMYMSKTSAPYNVRFAYLGTPIPAEYPVTFYFYTGGTLLVNGTNTNNGTTNYYYVNSVVNITAVASFNYVFSYYSYDTGTSTDNPFYLTVTQSYVVYTYFRFIYDCNWIGVNSTIGGKIANLSADWTDLYNAVGLSHHRLYTNNTGDWVNGTWSDVWFLYTWSVTTVTLNSTPGLVVAFRYFVNSSVGIEYASSYCFFKIPVIVIPPVEIAPAPSFFPKLNVFDLATLVKDQYRYPIEGVQVKIYINSKLILEGFTDEFGFFIAKKQTEGKTYRVEVIYDERPQQQTVLLDQDKTLTFEYSLISFDIFKRMAERNWLLLALLVVIMLIAAIKWQKLSATILFISALITIFVADYSILPIEFKLFSIIFVMAIESWVASHLSRR